MTGATATTSTVGETAWKPRVKKEQNSGALRVGVPFFYPVGGDARFAAGMR
jgi:hypothetical protein